MLSRLLCRTGHINQDEHGQRPKQDMDQKPVAVAENPQPFSETEKLPDEIPDREALTAMEAPLYVSGIEKLPVEILDQIMQDLPSSVKLSLRYTCRTLCLRSSLAIEQIFARRPHERLLFLCMLERDGKLSPWKLACSTCVKALDRSLFLTKSIGERPFKRKCRGHEGRMWICPHKIWDYTQVRAFRNGSVVTPSIRCLWNWPYGPCECENYIL